MKKILALVLALMVLAMGTTAFAANSTLPVGAAPTSGEYDGTVFYAELDSTATAPATQFVYSISNGTAVAATADKPAIKAGTGNVVFAATQENSNVSVGTDGKATVSFASGTGNRSIPVDLSFTGNDPAGIYRYIITQEAYGTGMVDAGFKTKDNGNGNAISYYLDVYKDSSKVYAVILSTEAGANLADNSKKVDRFVNLYSYDGTTTNPETYDVTIQKTLGSGGAEDSTQEFPFHVKVTVPYTAGTVDTNGMSFTITNGTASNFGTTLDIPANNNGAAVELEGKLKGGDSITIVGLPAGTVVEVYESPSAGDDYKISSKVTNMNTTGVVGAYDDPSTSTIKTETAYATKGTVIGNTDTDGTIDYLNYREQISPTGVVLRFAPYFAMLAGGVLLVLLAIKRRKTDED